MLSCSMYVHILVYCCCRTFDHNSSSNVETSTLAGRHTRPCTQQYIILANVIFLLQSSLVAVCFGMVDYSLLSHHNVVYCCLLAPIRHSLTLSFKTSSKRGRRYSTISVVHRYRRCSVCCRRVIWNRDAVFREHSGCMECICCVDATGGLHNNTVY